MAEEEEATFETESLGETAGVDDLNAAIARLAATRTWWQTYKLASQNLGSWAIEELAPDRFRGRLLGISSQNPAQERLPLGDPELSRPFTAELVDKQSELLRRARAVRARQKAIEGSEQDPLVRARRSADLLRDIKI